MNPRVAAGHTALDRVGLVEACSEGVVAEKRFHSDSHCWEGMAGERWVASTHLVDIHSAQAHSAWGRAEEGQAGRWAAGQVGLEEREGHSRWSCPRSWWRRGQTVRATGQSSLSDCDQHRAGQHRRCWRRPHLAGPKTRSRHRRAGEGVAVADIVPCLFLGSSRSSPAFKGSCGAESPRHPASWFWWPPP